MSRARVLIVFLVFILLFVERCSHDKEHIATDSPPPISSFINVSDTLTDELNTIRNNKKPRITSPLLVEATGDIYFRYIVHFDDPDGPDSIIAFEAYPDWLTADNDSLYGIPPDGFTDTGFIVSVSDGQLTDYVHVTVKMIPCLAVYGDSRSGHAIHRQLVDLMTAQLPAAVFHTGDLVNNGNLQSDWDTFDSITSRLRALSDFFPALGNHEHQSALYFADFDLPNNEQWYSVERNGIHFIILNTCVPINPGSEQFQWLESDLASIPDSIEFVAAVFHHPPYSTGQHAEDEAGLRQTIVPLFEQYGVDIVFNGHDHDYERSYCGGIYYIVAGGGGAPLRDQAREYPCSELYLKRYHYCKISTINDSLIVKVLDNNSSLIDQFCLINDKNEIKPPILNRNLNSR
jgi:hypothetical protein